MNELTDGEPLINPFQIYHSLNTEDQENQLHKNNLRVTQNRIHL